MKPESLLFFSFVFVSGWEDVLIWFNNNKIQTSSSGEKVGFVLFLVCPYCKGSESNKINIITKKASYLRCHFFETLSTSLIGSHLAIRTVIRIRTTLVNVSLSASAVRLDHQPWNVKERDPYRRAQSDRFFENWYMTLCRDSGKGWHRWFSVYERFLLLILLDSDPFRWKVEEKRKGRGHF